jgi:uncharacterized membrane protein YqjE
MQARDLVGIASVLLLAAFVVTMLTLTITWELDAQERLAAAAAKQ